MLDRENLKSLGKTKNVNVKQGCETGVLHIDTLHTHILVLDTSESIWAKFVLWN